VLFVGVFLVSINLFGSPIDAPSSCRIYFGVGHPLAMGRSRIFSTTTCTLLYWFEVFTRMIEHFHMQTLQAKISSYDYYSGFFLSLFTRCCHFCPEFSIWEFLMLSDLPLDLGLCGFKPGSMRYAFEIALIVLSIGAYEVTTSHAVNLSIFSLPVPDCS
jgi:hypothetical protein